MIGLEKHPTIFKNSYCPFLAVTKCDVTGLSQWERGWRRARLWLVSSLPSRIRCSPPPKTAEAVPLKKGAISWAQRWPPARPRSNGSLVQLFGEGAKGEGNCIARSGACVYKRVYVYTKLVLGADCHLSTPTQF